MKENQEPDDWDAIVMSPGLERFLGQIGVDLDELMPGTVEWDDAMLIITAYQRGMAEVLADAIGDGENFERN